MRYGLLLLAFFFLCLWRQVGGDATRRERTWPGLFPICFPIPVPAGSSLPPFAADLRRSSLPFLTESMRFSQPASIRLQRRQPVPLLVHVPTTLSKRVVVAMYGRRVYVM